MNAPEKAGTEVSGMISTRAMDRGNHLIQREVDAHHLDGANCANCGALLTGAFCSTCGQEAHLHRDITGFIHDVLHGAFHFDGKFWSTLPLLTFRPGMLTRRYIDGERAKFVTPMAMFLFSVFLMFIVVGNVPGWLAPSTTRSATTQIENARANIDRLLITERAKLARLNSEHLRLSTARQSTASLDARITNARRTVRKLEDAKIDLEKTDAAVSDLNGNVSSKHETNSFTGKEITGVAKTTSSSRSNIEILDSQWLSGKLAKARDNPKLLFYKMKSNGYKYSWALIPISLPFIWLMFAWHRRFGLYDHAVFATYSIAFMSLLIVVLTLVGWALGGFGQIIAWISVIILPPIHMYKQLRHGYELRRISTAWRTAVLLLVVSVTSLTFFVILLSFGLAD